MFPYQNLVLCIISLSFIFATPQYDVLSNYWLRQAPRYFGNRGDLYLMQDKLRYLQDFQQDKVKIQLYGECLCPDCRNFDRDHFVPTVKKLGKYLDIHVYPYGNARTYIGEDGNIDIQCQHGPAECYGNMLHACAIDNLQNITEAIYFNSCLMDFSQENKGSDDQAAEKCGNLMNIDPEPIMECAKGQRGLTLLKYYGEESKKAGFTSVPHILINGVQNSGENFMYDVCAAFRKKPQECNDVL